VRGEIDLDKDTRINELDITDEFFIAPPEMNGEQIAAELKKLGSDGVVLISQENEIIGFISPQEILDIVSAGKNPVNMSAAEIINTDYVELFKDETIGHVIPVIANSYPNAIVVINKDRGCVGFFSRNDYREVMAAMGEYDDSFSPQTPEDWRTKGIALSSKGKIDEAMQSYEKSIEAYPDKEKAWNKLAKTLEGMGRFKDALMCYDKAASLNVESDEAFAKKGEIHSKQNTQNLAIHCYQLALSVNPTNVSTLINLGVEYGNIGSIEEAINCFKQAQDIDGEPAEIWYRKAAVYSRDKQYYEALKCYDKAINSDIYYDNALFDKGVVLHKMGKDQDALECFEELIKVNPNNENAKRAIDSYRESGKFLF
jgi:tetratricopeptide (TPR) repeat protein